MTIKCNIFQSEYEERVRGDDQILKRPDDVEPGEPWLFEQNGIQVATTQPFEVVRTYTMEKRGQPSCRFYAFDDEGKPVMDGESRAKVHVDGEVDFKAVVAAFKDKGVTTTESALKAAYDG